MIMYIFQTADVLKGWNMELKANMIQFQGRVLPQERIMLGPGSNTRKVEFDWTPDLHCMSLYFLIFTVILKACFSILYLYNVFFFCP
jgi:hypothetical protein